VTRTAAPSTAIAPARGSRVALLLLLLGALLVGVSAGPAQAHAELESSTPADGAVLASAPRTVDLIFGEDIIDAGIQVVAQDSGGTAVPLDKAVAAGPKVSVAWPTTAGAGNYRVSYRVTSQDGHPIDGTISFFYGAASGSPTAAGSAASTGGATAGSQPGASAPATAAGSATSEPGTAAATSPAPSPAPAAADGRSQWWIIALLVVLGVIIGAVIARVLNQRRAKNS